MPNMIYPPTMQQQPIGNQNHQHQQNAIKPPPQMMNHHPSQMNMNQSNHLGPNAMLNQSMNNSNTLGHTQHGMQMQSGPPMYEHMLNPMNGNMKGHSDFIYLNQQHPHPLNMPQNQYMPSRNNVRFSKHSHLSTMEFMINSINFQITSSSTKKLWDNKNDMKNSGLAPLQMPGNNDHTMWSKDPQAAVWAKEQQMWSDNTSAGIMPRRSDNVMTGILR